MSSIDFVNRRVLHSGAFSDFHDIDPAAAALAASGFVFTTALTGAITRSAGPGGVLRISGAATTDNSGGQLRRSAGGTQIPIGKRAFNLSKFRISETGSSNVAVESDIVVGLGNTQADTDYIGGYPDEVCVLQKLDGSAIASVVVRAGAVQTTFAGVATLVAGVWYELWTEILLSGSGAGTLQMWLNNQQIVNHTFALNFFTPTHNLTEVAEFLSGDATGTKFSEYDWLGFFVEN